MLALSSVDALVAALGKARSVAVRSYTLARGPVLRAIEAAADRGARVDVCLQGAVLPGTSAGVVTENTALAAELRGHGAAVTLTGASDAPMHTKSATVDGTAYLDERNFSASDVILRDDPADPALAGSKRAALADERAVLATGGTDIVVESESFGCCNAVWAALRNLARSGVAPRVLVCARELRDNAREHAVLSALEQAGVRVRVTSSADKLAVAGDAAWLGSANATAAIATPDECDWGVATRDPAIVAAARARFESTWVKARPLDATGS